MKLLLLGEKAELLIEGLEKLGYETFLTSSELSSSLAKNFSFAISFGYRHIIKPDIINLFGDNIINLHISYLPYNRGADPNLWSFLDDTKKGVTIHRIEAGLDKGAILLQRQVEMSADETLRSSYDKLIEAIVSLFFENVDALLNKSIAPFYPNEKGSYHSLKDKERFLYLLESKGYDTLVSDLYRKNFIKGKEDGS